MGGVINFLGIILSELVTEFAMRYAEAFMHPTDLVMQLALLILLYLVIQVVMHYIPFVDKIVRFLVYPFSMLHLHVHIRTATFLARKRMQQYQEWRELVREHGLALSQDFQAQLSRRTRVRPLVSWSHSRFGESTRLFLAVETFRDAVLVAFSPLLTAVGFFFLSIPLREVFLAHATDEVSRALVHAYFSLALFGGLMPSLEDYRMITYVASRDRQTPLWVYLGIVLVGMEVTLVFFVAYNDMLVALIMGTLLALACQALLVTWEALVTILFHVITRARYVQQSGAFWRQAEESMASFVVVNGGQGSDGDGLHEVGMNRDDLIMLDPHEDEDWWDHHV